MAEKRRLHLSLPAEDLEWLEDNYGSYGAKTWFFRTALRQFRELHEISPEDIMTAAVKSIDLENRKIV